jgi:hypothetical protein
MSTAPSHLPPGKAGYWPGVVAGECGDGAGDLRGVGGWRLQLDVGLIPTRGANLFHVRDGKVMRLVLYWDRVKALEAVGLRE